MSGWFMQSGRAAKLSVIIALLLGACMPRGCERHPRGGLPELMVKLKEQGKRLTTVIEDGQPVLYYGSAPLTIFDQLSTRPQLRIRQSFPEFSRRWENEVAWRVGRDDSTAVEILDDLSINCRQAPHPDRQGVARLLARWRGDHAAVRADTTGVFAIKQLLQGLSSDIPADSARAADLIAAITADGAVLGERDSLALPSILSLLSHCPGIADSDSVAVLRFARRIREDGGVGGIADVALAAVRKLAHSQTIALRDSLAVASWIRLIAGDDAFGPPEVPLSVDLWLRIRVMSPHVKISDLLLDLNRISEVDTALVAHRVAPVPPVGTGSEATRSRLPPGLIGCGRYGDARAQGLTGEVQAYQTAAPIGIDAEHAWTVEGGDGSSARIILLDHGCATHDDLPEIDVIGEMPSGLPSGDLSHGTMTLGVLAAKKNNVEVLGTVLNVQELCFTSVHGSGEHEYNITQALDRAASRINDGFTGSSADIVVIEAQLIAENAESPGGCCNIRNDPSLLPVEADQDIFELILALVSQSVTVVEAAGNGAGEFVAARDSGAILVGAGEPDTHARSYTSNYGERVDCQGWGRDIRSTAIGESYEQAYQEFDGTSLATAVVGAAAASFQSAYVAKYLSPMKPTDLRLLLRDDLEYGTPQPDIAEGRIGPLPNLKALLAF